MAAEPLLRPSLRTTSRLLLRFLVVAATAFWVGGFFFYSGVVIHVGHGVLHSQRAQGFITQQVTVWLNVASLPALAIFLGNLLASWRHGRRWPRRLMLGAWLLMTAVQVALFAMHPAMDGLLDPPHNKIVDRRAFYFYHALYMALSAGQHFAGVGYAVLALFLWHRADTAGTATALAAATPAPVSPPAPTSPPAAGERLPLDLQQLPAPLAP
ncbi:MAG TPA: hypothetical protein VF796_17515 [Humisphaera sp.]